MHFYLTPPPCSTLLQSTRYEKTSSLYKSLKTLLLSLAVSDIGVGLLAQPSYVVRLIMVYVVRLVMESKQSNVTDTNYIVIYTSFFNDKFICFRLPRC